MNHRSFFRHAAVYGLASLLVQAAGFVLLPIYTHYLSVDDYGVLELVGRLAETVGTCLLFGGLRQTVLTFYQQSEDEAQRRRVVSTTLALLACACLLGGLLMLTLARPLGDLLTAIMHRSARPGVSSTPVITAELLRLAVLAILLEPLTLIPLALIQARLESGTFIVITLSQFLVRVTLCVVLVVWLGWGVAGVLTATALTAAAFGFGLCGRELFRGAARPDWGQARDLLRFALPFLPGGLCFFVLHHGDRVFLALCGHGADEVGTYALGYKLALTAGMFSLTPLYMVWSARMYEVARGPDAPEVFGRAFTRILAAYLLVGLALCLFQDEVVSLLGGRGYARAAGVVAPVLLACFFQAAASLMDAAFYVRQRTGLKLAITLAATLVILGLYALLIPPLGGLGAALATLGGFAFLAAHTWWATQRIFPVRYEWARLTALLGLAVVLWLASRALPLAPWTAPIKGLLWLLAPVLAWETGLISPDEKKYARDLARRVVAFLPEGDAWAAVLWPATPGADEPECVPARIVPDVTKAKTAHRPQEQGAARV